MPITKPRQAARATHAPAMWQARAAGSTTHPDHGWREVTPTSRERTVDVRVAYLRTIKHADGSPAYEFRALYLGTPLVEQAPALLEALTDLVAVQDSVDPEGLFRGLEGVKARAAIASVNGAAA